MQNGRKPPEFFREVLKDRNLLFNWGKKRLVLLCARLSEISWLQVLHRKGDLKVPLII